MEQRLRYWGIGLLVVGGLGWAYLPDLFLQLAHNQSAGLFWHLQTLALFVVLPAGAGLVAASLVIHALHHGASDLFFRYLIIAATALIAVGLALQFWGSDLSTGIADYLGPSGRPGALLAGFVLTVAESVALPLGIALAVTLPVITWVRQTQPAD